MWSKVFLSKYQDAGFQPKSLYIKYHTFNYFNLPLIKGCETGAPPFLFADSCSHRYAEKQLITANFRTEIALQVSVKMLKMSGEK